MHINQLLQFGLGLLIPPLAMVAGMYGMAAAMAYLMAAQLRRMHRPGADLRELMSTLAEPSPPILYGVPFLVAMVTLCAAAMWWLDSTLSLWGALSSLVGFGLFAVLKGEPPRRTGPFICGLPLSEGGRWASMTRWLQGILEVWCWFAAPFRPPPPDPDPIGFGPKGFQEAFTAEMLRANESHDGQVKSHGELMVLVETSQLGVATFTIRDDPPVTDAIRTAATTAFAQFVDVPKVVSSNLYVLKY